MNNPIFFFAFCALCGYTLHDMVIHFARFFN
jgi:hypothetical protein